MLYIKLVIYTSKNYVFTVTCNLNVFKIPYPETDTLI